MTKGKLIHIIYWHIIYQSIFLRILSTNMHKKTKKGESETNLKNVKK